MEDAWVWNVKANMFENMQTGQLMDEDSFLESWNE